VIFQPTDAVDGVTLPQPNIDHDKLGFPRHQRERKCDPDVKSVRASFLRGGEDFS
jgi:hypothetical protein